MKEAAPPHLQVRQLEQAQGRAVPVGMWECKNVRAGKALSTISLGQEGLIPLNPLPD